MFCFGAEVFLRAQDLDPRAYVRIPVNMNAIVSGFSFLSGNVITDPSLPVQNIKAKVQSPMLGYFRSFDLLGLTAQALVAVPYSGAQVSGAVGGQQTGVTRSGFADMRLRFSVLFLGAPAGNMEAVMHSERKTILGFSMNMSLPTGQYFPDKLINLGMHRWAFRPELALSQRLWKRWMVDVYAGVWYFTDNKEFYPGHSTRSQETMLSFQGHLSYTIRPFLWVALNANYYVGGTTTVDNYFNDDRQANSRVGITAAVPLNKHATLKFSASMGAIVRSGQDFTVYSIGYQFAWMDKKK